MPAFQQFVALGCGRFQQQEEELRKMRAFLAGKAEEEGDGKTMW